MSRKAVYSLKPPYAAPVWPVISSTLEQTILELLIPILEPIGQTRDVPRSKGVRRRKKKVPLQSENTLHSSTAPPPSDVRFLVTIGFNTTVGRLEAACQPKVQDEVEEKDRSIPARPLCVVFVAYQTLPTVLTSPLPVLAAMASAARPEEPAVRVVPLKEQSVSELAQILRQPRVGLIGLERNLGEAASLEKLITENFAPIDVPWVHQNPNPSYLPVNIHKEDHVSNPDKPRKPKKRPKIAG